jgi:hypothetical protein
MKPPLNQCLFAIQLFVSSSLYSQGFFFNLDFELSQTPVSLGPGLVPITNALPGWAGTVGDVQIDEVWYNTRTVDAAMVSLQSSTSQITQPLQGTYSVFLLGASIVSPPASASIAQSGLIPSGSKSILFLSSPAHGLQVSFAGQPIPLIELGTGTDYVVLGGDVSQFAGLLGELRFTAPPLGGAVLDNIQFSTQSIPEPGILGLLGLGVLSMAVLRR